MFCRPECFWASSLRWGGASSRDRGRRFGFERPRSVAPSSQNGYPSLAVVPMLSRLIKPWRWANELETRLARTWYSCENGRRQSGARDTRNQLGVRHRRRITNSLYDVEPSSSKISKGNLLRSVGCPQRTLVLKYMTFPTAYGPCNPLPAFFFLLFFLL